MSARLGFLRGSRVLYSAVKSTTRAPSSKPAASGATLKKPTTARGGSSEKKISGILKPVQVSPVLYDFVGVPEISRTEVVKKVWEHIKLNNLQNPSNKKEIFCDEKLKKLFDGKDKVGFLEIAKLLSPHFIKST